MNNKNIARHLRNKIDDWLKTIKDDDIKSIISKNVIITGGAIVSLLNGEQPKDYDCYFKTEESCMAIAKYYATLWNKSNETTVDIRDDCGRITCFIQSSGIAENSDMPYDNEDMREPYIEDLSDKKQPKYRPKFFSTNAISLSDKIQIVIRFYGSVDDIHTNYDFVHCTCSYDYYGNKVSLPSKALESILNKELHYMGSKYPLCSIIRTRKFIARGYHINAGQYLKMAWQLNQLDLSDTEVLKDQLAGV
ncbi:MAG: hypothetical protein RR612_08565, partial [Oscillospiraceae bacterium]